MKPAAFEYERPSTLEGALEALARHRDDAKILAGGQSLIPLMNLRMVQFGTLIDIGRIDELKQIKVVDDELVIGALATHNAILNSSTVAEHIPLITEAYHDVAHHSVRNKGTLGGSLCHNDPASEMPLIMAVLNARVFIRSSEGSREISVEHLLVSAFSTSLESEELLTEIRIPIPPQGHGFAFHEVAQRKGDYALVACAAVIVRDGSELRDVRVRYRNVGIESVRMATVEALLEGKTVDEETIAHAARVAMQTAQPQNDIHASAEYRRDIIGHLTEKVLARAASRASCGL